MPKYEQNRNSAAIVPDQKVYWLVRSNEKSNIVMRPVDAAIASPSVTLTPSGSPRTAVPTMANSANTTSTMILTSVQVDA